MRRSRRQKKRNQLDEYDVQRGSQLRYQPLNGKVRLKPKTLSIRYTLTLLIILCFLLLHTVCIRSTRVWILAMHSMCIQNND